MPNATDRPTVFISYSWDGDAHKEWVLRLATDLRRSGVDVILDRWALALGDDLAAFMETSVTRAEFLLLVCTDEYAEKANTRRGGVGYEQAIITGGLLTDSSTTAKLVPALRSGTPATALPNYLKTRLFVDFRSDEHYARSLDQLLRHFYRVPEVQMPPHGPAPEFTNRAGAGGVEQRKAATPRKWILVAGTGSEKSFTTQERETAARVGEMLARNSFGVISGGWPGVDDAVGRAFAEEIARMDLPLENFLVQIVAETRLPTFPAGDLIIVKDGTAEWTEGIDRADAVVLIGGLGGTLTSGELAAEQGKPVFPLADTGRDAKKFYVTMLRDWDRLGPPRISRTVFQRMARPAPGVVDDLGELLQSL